jgi:hypothetical protein
MRGDIGLFAFREARGAEAARRTVTGSTRRENTMSKRWFLLIPVVAAFLSLALFAGACGDDNGDEDGAPTETPAESPQATAGTPAEGAIGVSLTEFNVVADPDTASAGTVTFNVDNLGVEIHEFVIVKTDTEPGALPTATDGGVDEAGAGIEVIDEIEDIPAGESAEPLDVELEAGSYVLLCNIVEEEDGETVSHYQEGMHTAFTVE